MPWKFSFSNWTNLTEEEASIVYYTTSSEVNPTADELFE